MRALCQQPIGMLALMLVAMFALQAGAYAENDYTEVTIGTAVVRYKVVGGKTYIAVKSGGPLKLQYADGKEMASIPDGTALMVSGLTGGPSISGGVLRLAPLVLPERGRENSFSIALSRGSRQSLSFNPPGYNMGSIASTRAYNVSPGKTRTVINHFRPDNNRILNYTDYERSLSTNTAGTERDLLSLSQ